MSRPRRTQGRTHERSRGLTIERFKHAAATRSAARWLPTVSLIPALFTAASVPVDSIGALSVHVVVPVFSVSQVLIRVMRASSSSCSVPRSLAKKVCHVVETSWTRLAAGIYYATDRQQRCEKAAQREEAIQPGQDQEQVSATSVASIDDYGF